jgi:hypothetical protein
MSLTADPLVVNQCCSASTTCKHTLATMPTPLRTQTSVCVHRVFWGHAHAAPQSTVCVQPASHHTFAHELSNHCITLSRPRQPSYRSTPNDLGPLAEEALGPTARAMAAGTITPVALQVALYNLGDRAGRDCQLNHPSISSQQHSTTSDVQR